MFGSRSLIMAKRETGWTPTMEQRAGLEGRQVKCLIASEGHLWMQGYYDRFPGAVRQRLAASPFNICPACMDEDARRAAQQRGEPKPSIATYFTVIAQIERKLR
jgi:hypothetical protein